MEVVKTNSEGQAILSASWTQSSYNNLHYSIIKNNSACPHSFRQVPMENCMATHTSTENNKQRKVASPSPF